MRIVIIIISAAMLALAVGPDAFTEAPPSKAPTKKKAKKPTDEPIVIDSVVVTGSRREKRRRDEPVVVEVIGRKQIRTSRATSVADLLASHPGLSLSRSFRGSTIQINGMGAKHVLVLVDGLRINGRVDGTVDLSRFAVHDLERIEVLKGPGSALYGSDAMGGVINIITRKTKKSFEADADLSYATLTTLATHARIGFLKKRWRLRLSGGFFRTDAYDLNPDDATTNGSARTEWSLRGRLGYELNRRTTFFLGTEYIRRDLAGVDANSAGAVFDRLKRIEAFTGVLGARLRFSAPSRFSVTAQYRLYRDQFALDQRGSAALDRAEDTLDHLTQLSLQYDRFWDSHTLNIGLDGMLEFLRSVRLLDGKGERYRGALYAQHEWTIYSKRRLMLVLGARLDLDSKYGAFPAPKISVLFDPHRKVTLRLGYGMGFRSPDFKELLLLFENLSANYVVEGNPDLAPETSHNGTFNLEYRPTRWARFNLGLFINDITNLIFTAEAVSATTDQTRRFSYINIGRAYTRGGEFAVTLGEVEGFSFRTTYVFTDTWDRDNDRPLEGRAAHRVNFDLRYRYKPWGTRFTARGRVVGPRPFYTEAGTRTAPTYLNLDLRLGQRVGEHLTLYLGAQNLLNAGDAFFLPIQPRSFYGGIRGRI